MYCKVKAELPESICPKIADLLPFFPMRVDYLEKSGLKRFIAA